jgi:excisionase family DNA binding protein
MKLTPKEAAARARVSLSLVYSWCNSHSLVHFRIGRQGRRGLIRIEDSDLDSFLSAFREERQESLAPLALKHIKLK